MKEKVTISLDAEILLVARHEALDVDSTLSEYINELLEWHLQSSAHRIK